MISHRLSILQPFSAAMTAMMLVGAVLSSTPVHAAAPLNQSHYTTTLPFTTDTVAPNILLVLDNSGSMDQLASRSLPPFDPNTDYSGIYEPRQCYMYNTGQERFITSGAFPKSVANDCPNPSHPWDGSVLNYVTMRRMDIAKVVMNGGRCDGARNLAGACPSENLIPSESFGEDIGIAAALLTNRIDAPLLTVGLTVFFHAVGSPFPPLNNFLCVDNVPFFGGTCAVNGVLTRVRVKFETEPTGVIQEIGDRARFALMVYNPSEGGRIIVDMGNNSAMLTQIDNTMGIASTPLGETLYEATRYLAQLPPVFNELGPDYIVSLAKDPFYFQPPWVSAPQHVTCCKTFIILFTDGEPNSDGSLPTGLQDFAHVAGTHTAAHHALPSHFVDDVAYWAHTTDLRQATVPIGTGPPESGQDLPGIQNVSIYTFFAFGANSNLLRDTAKVGGFTDRNANNLPDLPEEYDRINNLTGVTGADGVPDNYFEASEAEVMADRLRAAIYSILSASTSSTAVSVLSSSASGEGATYQAYFFPSVFEGINEIRWLGFTQGLFVDVYGHLREDTNGDGKLVYLEDKIIVMRFETSTNTVKVDRYVDVDGDGTADSVTPSETVEFTEIKPIWEAGRRLALTDPDTRRILTWVDPNDNGKVDTGEVISFSSANAAALAPYLRPKAAPYTTVNTINFIRGTQVATLRDRVRTVKNDVDVNVSTVWKLGDIVNSSPVIVGRPSERYDFIYGDASYSAYLERYKDRRQVVYVGANDGMLHAFNAGFYTGGDDTLTPIVERGRFDEVAPASVTAKYLVRPGNPKRGQELWGFIPQELLPQLQWLMQPDYAHVDYVDLPVKITDARIFTPDADHPNGWGTILIGGMRFGGSCDACSTATGGNPMKFDANFDGFGVDERTFYSAYFVLDITNPEQDPVLLWSFSDSKLGLTTSRPAVVRVSPTSDVKTDNTNAQWFMVVGSGVTTYAGKSTQKSRIFVVDLKTGPRNSLGTKLYSRFDTEDDDTATGDVMTTDVDLDYRVDVIYAGTTHRTGGIPEFTGKLYRLTTKGCSSSPCTRATWGVDESGSRVPTVLLNTFGLLTTPMGPVTAAPNASIDDKNAIWVYWGTGHFYGDGDQSNTDTQHFFGVKDPVVTGDCTEVNVTTCQQTDLVDVSSAVVCSVCLDLGIDEVEGVATVTDFEGLQNLTQSPSQDGWFTTLPALGERSLSRASVLGGMVVFTTFSPDTGNVCNSKGSGRLYGLFYLTGTAYTASMLGTEAVGLNSNLSRFVELGAGLPSQVSVHVGRNGTADNGTTGSATGCSGRVTFYDGRNSAVDATCGKPALGFLSGLISWRDL